MLRLPKLLERLIADGRWPSKDDELKQNLSPLVGPERIRELAPEESSLYLNFTAFPDDPRGEPGW